MRIFWAGAALGAVLSLRGPRWHRVQVTHPLDDAALAAIPNADSQLAADYMANVGSAAARCATELTGELAGQAGDAGPIGRRRVMDQSR